MDDLETPARIDPWLILGTALAGLPQRHMPTRSRPLERRWKTCEALLPKEGLCLALDKIRFAVLAPDGIGLDVLLAERADALVGWFLLEWDCRLAVHAARGVYLDFFLAERTLGCR